MKIFIFQEIFSAQNSRRLKWNSRRFPGGGHPVRSAGVQSELTGEQLNNDMHVRCMCAGINLFLNLMS